MPEKNVFFFQKRKKIKLLNYGVYLRSDSRPPGGAGVPFYYYYSIASVFFYTHHSSYLLHPLCHLLYMHRPSGV
jgi:hypothetical protein